MKLLALVLSALVAAAEAPPENRWEPNIQKFEAADAENPPAPGQIVFVGSSSIVGWNLKKWFGDLDALNRGFGGSRITDSLHFAERIIVKYQPRGVVIYAGDNDIGGGATPEATTEATLALIDLLHERLPATRVIYLPIKPSLRRWTLWPRMQQVNAAIQARAATDERLVYVDLATPMLGADGQPRPELFKTDGLHLNDTGYELWTELLRPHLPARPAAD